MFDFTGKRVLVTGAASGIGDATARQLIAAGAQVVSLDRNEPAAAVAHHRIDLADVGSIDSVVARLDGTFDALFNVAGLPGTAPAEKVMAVNVFGMRHLTEALLERLTPGGSVVVVSSTAGFGWPQRLETIKELLATDTFDEAVAWFADNPQEGNAYNFSKECATVYTMTMGVALHELGLRINAVLPGPVRTPILEDFRKSMGEDTIDGAAILLGRHAEPDEVASAILFLASPGARWINGHPLIVDGGLSGTYLTGLVPLPEI
ncbi:coniferyl-alcohol dehydrogenase [Nocardia shimofusensis]|uniref:coniferyl-alcohol dehydrogenase n=1 Tax=Nocardia shimofusensis TaxID=228596 RepID=UPI0008296461|nr:coniferyl-alcohol dehydrogenase [Nocardia shimofusensis]